MDLIAQESLETTVKLSRLWKWDHRGLACEWRKRERNLEADWACNAALDAQTGFCWLKEVPDPASANIILYSDGGLRERETAAPSRKVAAYGLAIRTFLGNESKLIAMGAEIIDDELATVPSLELQGLRAAKHHMQMFIQGQRPEPRVRELIINNSMIFGFVRHIGETQ